MSDTTETQTQTPDATPISAPRARLRWGAVAWGLITIAIGSTVLVVLTDVARRAAFLDWFGSLTIGAAVLLLVVVAGALLLLLGLLAVARRAQAAR